jgi:hypothetical protein
MIKDVDRDSKLTSLFIFDFVIALSAVGRRSNVASAGQRRAAPSSSSNPASFWEFKQYEGMIRQPRKVSVLPPMQTTPLIAEGANYPSNAADGAVKGTRVCQSHGQRS